MTPAGSVNGWFCKDCARVTYAVHVDDGVTPMLVACRADGVHPTEARSSCKGTAMSLMYPKGPTPPDVLASVLWEWYRPDGRELAAMKRFEPDGYVHVVNGGLELRKLTDAGRRFLGQRRGATASERTQRDA